MPRVFAIVLDSLGVGAMPDAAEFGDAGSHTLDHIVAATGGLDVPRLVELGLGNVPGVAGLEAVERPLASYGRMAERSPGKDTSTGHWEMMGCVLAERFPVFAEGFPSEIIDDFILRTGVPGVLENRAASGTEVIARLGAEHVRTGKPIVYTSADSVFQVAAHEQHYGLERLLDHCRIAREILLPYNVARVIARPFIGEPGAYERTYNRRDFSLLPPEDNTLTRLVGAGVLVVGVGKIEDIFAGVGVPRSIHTEGNRDGMRVLTELARDEREGFFFVNLVDFDMLYGHRRDPAGYRRALEQFDADYREFEQHLEPGDVVLLTADHGNDPTHTTGTDHTREYVPILAHVEGAPGRALGTRTSFADLGATVEELFALRPAGPGRSFAAELGLGEGTRLSDG